MAAVLLFGLAVVLDFLEGLDPSHGWNLYAAVVARYDIATFTETRFRETPYDTLVHFSRSLEEFVEMLANTCIWTALLRHVPAAMQGVRIEGGSHY